MKYFTGHWESDCCILTSYLEEIEYYSGSDRLQRQFKSMKKRKNEGSMLYGSTFKGFLKYDDNGNKILRKRSNKYKNMFETKCKEMYPELEYIFKEFSSLYFPEFKYSQVQLNKNYQCPKHYDSKNINESILLTLGNYEGGFTQLEIGNHIVDIDSHYKLARFNGSKYKHWTTPFTGTRYALVFFNNSKLKLID